MNILTVSGSSRPNSANIRLLEKLPSLFPGKSFSRFTELDSIPLFSANAGQASLPKPVLNWKQALNLSDALIICTPEYLHNIPAAIKNGLEWISESGELAGKKVLPITFTPHPPRGEKAMQSLIWSLQALNAQIVVQLSLYQNESPLLQKNEELEILGAAIDLLEH